MSQVRELHSGRKCNIQECSQPCNEVPLPALASKEGAKNTMKLSLDEPSVAQTKGPLLQIPISSPKELEDIIAQAIVKAMATIAAKPEDQPTSPVEEFVKSLEQAKALGAQDFFGTTDPAEAENWFKMTERILTQMRCTDEQRVKIATFLLKGDAWHRWGSFLGPQSQETLVTWDEFRGKFYEQYFLDLYIEGKRKEFYSLTQGSMSVAEYEARFTELSRFVQCMLADEEIKCRQFEDGLRTEIQLQTCGCLFKSFKRLVEAAIRAESAQWFQAGGERAQNPRTDDDIYRPTKREIFQAAPLCGSCGRQHDGECLFCSGRCFHCRQFGHRKRECPSLVFYEPEQWSE